MEAYNLSNKIALITGASRGLGRNTALSIARRGGDVVLTYQSRGSDAEAGRFVGSLARAVPPVMVMACSLPARSATPWLPRKNPLRAPGGNLSDANGVSVRAAQRVTP